MKKILFSLIALGISILGFGQTTYYTCTSPSGTNLTTASDGSGLCNVAIGTWNQSANTIIIRSGSTFELQGSFTINCKVIVQSGGTLNNVTASGNQTFNSSNSFNVPPGVNQITATGWGGGGAGGGSNNAGFGVARGGGGGGGGARVQSLLTVTPSSTLSVVVGEGGTGVSANHGNDGGYTTITGFEGEFYADGGIGGRRNTTGNSPAGGSGGLPGQSKGDVITGGNNGGSGATGLGIKSGSGGWAANPNGGAGGDSIPSQGTTSNGNPGTQPGGGGSGSRTSQNGGSRTGGNGGAGRVIIEWSVNPNLVLSNNVIVAGTVNGGLITLSGDSFSGTGAINFNSLTINTNTPAIFHNNFSVSEGTITGSGQIKLVRDFSASKDWSYIGWPITGSATVNDLVPSGGMEINHDSFPQIKRNIYYWRGDSAGWIPAPKNFPLTGNSFCLFNFGASPKVSLTISTSDLNNNTMSQSFVYYDPGSVPPGNATGWTNDTTITDGWNMWINPYQQSINPDNFNLPGDLNNAVYVWNGSTYISRVGGVGPLTGISPNQAFFVRTPANGGNHSIPQAARTTTSATAYFKNDYIEEEIALTLTGEGYKIQSFIYQTPLATDRFDNNFDAYYFAHSGKAPHFNSVGIDSTAYCIQGVPKLNETDHYLSFYYGSNGKNFTISIDRSKLNNITQLFLHDLHTNTITDLMQKDYTFTSVKQAAPQRFKLSINNYSVDVPNYVEDDVIKVWFQGSELRLNELERLENASIQVFSFSGQLVEQGSTEAPIYIYQTGVYIVKIKTKDGQTHNFKVVKM